MVRYCGPNVGGVRLPKVPASHGTRSVSPMVREMDSMGTRNSSATCCANDVRMFWPTSTFPVKTVTCPSPAMRSQAAMSFGNSWPPLLRPDSCATVFSPPAEQRHQNQEKPEDERAQDDHPPLRPFRDQ